MSLNFESSLSLKVKCIPMVDLNDNRASALCVPLRLQDTDSDKLGLEPSYGSDLDKTSARLIFRKRKKNL